MRGGKKHKGRAKRAHSLGFKDYYFPVLLITYWVISSRALSFRLSFAWEPHGRETYMYKRARTHAHTLVLLLSSSDGDNIHSILPTPSPQTKRQKRTFVSTWMDLRSNLDPRYGKKKKKKKKHDFADECETKISKNLFATSPRKCTSPHQCRTCRSSPLAMPVPTTAKDSTAVIFAAAAPMDTLRSATLQAAATTRTCPSIDKLPAETWEIGDSINEKEH